MEATPGIAPKASFHSTFRANMVVLVLVNLGNVCNYLVQVIVGRNLSAEDFGIFNSLNSLSIIGSLTVFVLPLIMTRQTIAMNELGPGQVAGLLRWTSKVFSLAGAGVFLLGLVISPLVGSYLHINTVLSVPIVFATLAVNVIRPVPWGVLQGLERFWQYGLVAGWSSLVRLLAALGLVWLLPWGVDGALTAGLLSVVWALVLAFWYLRDILNLPPSHHPRSMGREMLAFAVPAAMCGGITQLFGNLDIILARHYCEAVQAGMFASASVLGRIGLFLPSALLGVLFPRSVKEKGNTSLYMGLGMTLFISGGYALACLLGGRHIISLLFGSGYVEASALLGVTATAMGVLAISNVLFVHALARRRYGFIWLGVAGALLLAGLVHLWHATPMAIALDLLVSTSFVLASTALWLMAPAIRPRRDFPSAQGPESA